MKTLPLLLLLVTTTCLHSAAADDDWRKAARAFLKDQNFAPIEIKPGTRFQTDLSRERWQWQQRVLLPTLEKHLEKWPVLAERARGFVKQSLLAQLNHPDVDRSRTPEALEKEGLELEKAGVDEPLVLWATAWAAWDWREGYLDAHARLHKAVRHKTLKDYPAALPLMIRKLIYAIEEDRNEDEPTHDDAYFKAGLQAATDSASYTAKDDEILWHDTGHVFYRQYVEKHQDEMEKLAQTPGFTPWLKEMMLGKLHSSLGWKSRGGDYAGTVTDEGWKGFEQHMPVAAAHFRAAWELHHDRADPATQMVDIIKTGFAEPGETTRLWFDRAVAAQFDATEAYYDYVWALRPRWGGSVNKIRALLLACALTERPDTELADVVLKLVDFIKSDSDATDARSVLQTPVLKEAILHTVRAMSQSPARVWERPWRAADLGVYNWMAGEFVQADEILKQVPVPFPRQTRRNLDMIANEIEVRGQSAIFSLGMEAEWEALEQAYAKGKSAEALEDARTIAARFLGEPPQMLLEKIASCEFEIAFAKQEWVKITALPDLVQWHNLSGPWRGSQDGTLSIRGHDAPAFLLHNGRVGRDFEIRGDYTVEGNHYYQGLGVVLGYNIKQEQNEDFLACSMWGASRTDGAIVSMLQDFAQSDAPEIKLRSDDPTWRFHIVCRSGNVTYRLNHQDILRDHQSRNEEEVFSMTEDGRVGLNYHFFSNGTTTSIRHLEIRRLPSVKKNPPADIAELNQLMQVEIADRAAETKAAGYAAEAVKIEAFGKALQSASTEPEALPVVTLAERALHSLLRGYAQSVAERTGKAMAPPLDADLLADSNTVRWQPETGTWKLEAGVLTGNGDSSISYDFGQAPPFQIDFEITVLDGMRPRLVMGKVKFANEAYKTTFGLYPQPKGVALFTYERHKPYQITIKATQDKTELLVDGIKVCDGPKIEGVVDVLQFRSGDDWSKGKTEFRKIRISLPP